MTSYLQTQVAVYKHLLARHEADPTLTFSLRQSFRKEPTSTEGLFIGTEKSRYFAFTLWSIPVSYPGSSIDLLTYVVELNRDGSYFLSLLFFITKNSNRDQNSWSLKFAETLLQQPWPSPVQWIAEKPGNKARKLVYTKAKRPGTVVDLLAALDELLSETAGILDRAIAEHQLRFPGWKAERFTLLQFQKMRTKMEQKCAPILDGSYNPPRRATAFWCVQLEDSPAPEQAWQEFKESETVAPDLPADATLAPFFSGQQEVLTAEQVPQKRLLDQFQFMLTVQEGDILVVGTGHNKVRAVGLALGAFTYEMQEDPPYRCPVEWLTTSPVGVSNNTLLTGVPFSRTQGSHNSRNGKQR